MGININFPKTERWGRYGLPVINVSWEDADAYLKWLSQKTNNIYRLPTEAEWEYAARAETDAAFLWGGTIGGNLTNCDNYTCKDSFDYTAPVGSFVANPFGLHDMDGNVPEWVFDWLDYYPNSVTASDPQGPDAGTFRVLRGGEWDSSPQSLRLANRSFNVPYDRDRLIGFRSAQTYGK